MNELELALNWFSKEVGSDLIKKLVYDGIVNKEDVVNMYRQHYKKTHVYCFGCHKDITHNKQFEFECKKYCDACVLLAMVDVKLIEQIQEVKSLEFFMKQVRG